MISTFKRRREAEPIEQQTKKREEKMNQLLMYLPSH